MPSTKEQLELLKLAEVAAKRSGQLIRSATEKIVHKKGRVDLCTQTDLASEAQIVQFLQQECPNIPILAEEGGGTKDRTRWIVDPLDGTTNFVHGLPHFSVSIALEIEGVLQVGCVYAPMQDESFTAYRGGGAFCNGEAIQVSQTESLQDSLLITGFPYHDRQRSLPLLTALFERAQGIRRLGSAALDLAFVSCGRADGFWELILNPWDVAAGVLLVREAGGNVLDLNGQEYSIDIPGIFANNGTITEEVQLLLQNVHSM